MERCVKHFKCHAVNERGMSPAKKCLDNIQRPIYAVPLLLRMKRSHLKFVCVTLLGTVALLECMLDSFWDPENVGSLIFNWFAVKTWC